MAGRDIKITIIGDATKAQKAFADAGTSAGTFETKVEGLGSKFGTFAGTLGGVVAGGALASLPGLLMDGAKGAAEDEAAMLRLQQAVENTGKSYDSQSGAIEDAIKRGQELAFTDGETAEALAQLTAMTGDSDEALRRLSLAQDLARGTGIPLEQAAKLLGKTSDENTAALGRLGIKLGENATAQDVLNAVDEKYKGQAGIFAESQAGQMAIATQQAGELAEGFGSLLLPVIGFVTTAMLGLMTVIQSNIIPAVAGFVESLSGLQPILDPVIAFIQENLTAVLIGLATMLLTVVVPAFVTWAASAAAAAAATVVALAPVIAIAAAVGIAVAALYLAWDTNFLGIRDVTQQVLDFILPYVTSAMSSLLSAVEAAVNGVRVVWDAVFPYIRSVVETVFPIIAQIATTYINILKTEIELGVQAARWAFDNVFVPIQGIVSDVFTTISGLVTTLWGPTVTAIESGVNAAKVAFDGLVYIQGIVSDIFTTISGIVVDLWLGASGAVGMILAGLGTIYGAFAGAYDTMVGHGRAIVQGLIDGVASLYDTLKGWFDKITELMKIDVPGMSPPYHAGYEQGARFVRGLTDGIESEYGPFDSALGDIGGRMGNVGGTGSGGAGGRDPIGGPGSGGTGGRGTGGTGSGGTGGRPTADPDNPFYYEPPPYTQVPTPDPVIGEPASGLNNNAGWFANPQNVGGGQSFGVMDARRQAEEEKQQQRAFLTEQERLDREFLNQMKQYMERIVKSNEAVPGATARAVRSALAGAIGS